MNFKTFMQKLDRKDDGKTNSCSEKGAGGFDVSSIMRIARGFGYRLEGMEQLSVFPDGVCEAFQRGFNNSSMGMLVEYPNDGLAYIYCTGLHYAKQIHRNTQGSVQEELSSSLESDYDEPEWAATNTYYGINAIPRVDGTLTVGCTARNTLTGEGLTGSDQSRASLEYFADQRRLRQTIGSEEGGISGVRDERESGERSEEDTRELYASGVERLTRWEIRQRTLR